jgi:hypothetical protein
MSATPAIFAVAPPLMHTSHDSGAMGRREATVMRAEIRDRPPPGQQVGGSDRAKG